MSEGQSGKEKENVGDDSQKSKPSNEGSEPKAGSSKIADDDPYWYKKGKNIKNKRKKEISEPKTSKDVGQPKEFDWDNAPPAKR